MRQPLPKRSPEVWSIACQEMARRAQGGTLAYPAAIALLGLGADLHRTSPGAFSAIAACALLLGVGRLFLIRRFDPLYSRSPSLWQAGFFGGALATGALYSGLLCFLTLEKGLAPSVVFALAATLGIEAMVIVTYFHSLPVLLSYILLLGVPPTAALLGLAGAEPSALWLAWANVGSTCYLLWVGWQQHQERWRGLAKRHRLEQRAGELERAHEQVQRARGDLERLVAERTRDLERTSRNYQQIFENAHDAIIVFRPEDEQVLNVNRRACEVYGFTREEFLRISLASISVDVPRGQQQLRQTIEGGVYHNFESVQYRKDGSRMFLEINAATVEYEGRTAIISINRDVTERRRNEALRLAKEAAERAARAKAQFLANMSHEIRTPMAGVIGLSDLLLATDLDERQTQYARLIQSSTGSLLRVIDDILDFSKIEAGKLTFDVVPFDLRATLSEVVEVLRLAAMSKGTTLELDLAPDLPVWVSGDPGRLRQVLMNLVGNAVKFTEGGEVTVRAEPARLSPDHTGRVFLRVKDTGIGIPEEARGRLFELFSQGDGSTSRRFGGTGLGLAISKRIVEAMGGEIGFESEAGKGSTFWIRVPLAPGAEPAQAERAARRPASAHILTVEDNPINQIVITEQLKHLGYQVTAAANGLEALEALAVDEYDLVLMDCQMPHLDGYEATERIRRLPGKVSQVPIVALTAHAIQEELDRCLDVGMNDYITKPFRAEELQRKLERWLGGDIGPPGNGSERPAPEPAGSLDLRQLESLRAMCKDSGPGFVSGLVDQFRSQPYLEELRAALECGDRALLKARAHGLKGTSSLLGARRLPRLCEELERSCLLATREECLRQIEQIDAEHQRFVLRLVEDVM